MSACSLKKFTTLSSNTINRSSFIIATIAATIAKNSIMVLTVSDVFMPSSPSVNLKDSQKKTVRVCGALHGCSLILRHEHYISAQLRLCFLKARALCKQPANLYRFWNRLSKAWGCYSASAHFLSLFASAKKVCKICFGIRVSIQAKGGGIEKELPQPVNSDCDNLFKIASNYYWSLWTNYGVWMSLIVTKIDITNETASTKAETA